MVKTQHMIKAVSCPRTHTFTRLCKLSSIYIPKYAVVTRTIYHLLSPPPCQDLAKLLTAPLPCQYLRLVRPPCGLDHDGAACAEVCLGDPVLACSNLFLYPLHLLYLPAEFVRHARHLSPVGKGEIGASRVVENYAALSFRYCCISSTNDHHGDTQANGRKARDFMTDMISLRHKYHVSKLQREGDCPLTSFSL